MLPHVYCIRVLMAASSTWNRLSIWPRTIMSPRLMFSSNISGRPSRPISHAEEHALLTFQGTAGGRPFDHPVLHRSEVGQFADWQL